MVFAIVGAIGAFAGSSLGKAVDATHLLIFFGVLMVAVGALMLRPKRSSDKSTEAR